jgi:hypothetical protein
VTNPSSNKKPPFVNPWTIIDINTPVKHWPEAIVTPNLNYRYYPPTMSFISLKKLESYRTHTFRLASSQKLTDLQSAIQFVRERGFVYFWPIKNINLPSLWTAVAGLRPVASAHDDPGHITWGWKDESLGLRVWYYAKVLRKRATMIDIEVAPYFYALSNNFGNPVEDIRIQYLEGSLTLEAKSIFEAILENGPMDTIALRRATRMTNKESNYRFERALTFLQSDFKVLPIGVSDAGGWRYAFIYELVHRYYPSLLEKARAITENQARQELIRTYFHSVGAAQFRDLSLLFQWPADTTQKTISYWVDAGKLVAGCQHPESSGNWYALPELIA